MFGFKRNQNSYRISYCGEIQFIIELKHKKRSLRSKMKILFLFGKRCLLVVNSNMEPTKEKPDFKIS